MKKIFISVFLMGFLVACGSSVEVNDNPDLIYTQVAQTVRAEYTQAAEKTAEAPPTQEPTATETPSIGTRSNPVPIGQPIDLIYQGIANFQITVFEVIRGQAAWDRVYQANMFNEPPLDGQEYIVAKVSVNFQTSTQPDYELLIDSFSFGSVSNNQVLNSPSVVNPEPELNVKLFAGGQGEGYITVSVYSDDPSPLIVYEDWISFNSAPFYFATN